KRPRRRGHAHHPHRRHDRRRLRHLNATHRFTFPLRPPLSFYTMRDQTTLAQQLIDRCLDRGASAAEVTLSQGYETEIEVRDGKVDRLGSGQPSSVSLRVWRGDRVASTRGTRLDEQTLQTLIHDAVELADLSDPVPGMTLA